MPVGWIPATLDPKESMWGSAGCCSAAAARSGAAFGHDPLGGSCARARAATGHCPKVSHPGETIEAIRSYLRSSQEQRTAGSA